VIPEEKKDHHPVMHQQTGGSQMVFSDVLFQEILPDRFCGNPGKVCLEIIRVHMFLPDFAFQQEASPYGYFCLVLPA